MLNVANILEHYQDIIISSAESIISFVNAEFHVNIVAVGILLGWESQ